jgi:hypothetical protein
VRVRLLKEVPTSHCAFASLSFCGAKTYSHERVFSGGWGSSDRQAKAFSVNGKMIKKIGGDHINAHSVLATKNLLVPLLTKHL